MDKTITKKTKTVEIIEYIGKCEKCGKKIVGSTEGQVRFNLLVHQQGKECRE